MKSGGCAPTRIPSGRLVEQLLATAYVAHNYGRSGVGWPSEVSQINATEAMEFHKNIMWERILSLPWWAT